MMQCNEKTCGEVVAIVGRALVEEYYYLDEDGDEIMAWNDVFYPEIVQPAPRMFAISKQCSADVEIRIVEAFSLFWIDISSAANKVRVGIECLLTSQGVPRYAKAKKGSKRTGISLHKRIEAYHKINSEAAECLMAAKWLGNHGSHADSGLSREDFFDAMDLMEHVFTLIYNDKKFIVKKAKKINAKKGPIKIH